MRDTTLVLGGSVCVALLVLAGCRGNDGPKRIAVSGKVTFRGQPVDDGQIRFVAQGETLAPVTIVRIKGGAYDTIVSGGVPVGTHRIEIRSYDPKEPEPTGPGQPPRRQLLPAKYNASTQLEITIPPDSPAIIKNFGLTD